MLMLKLQRIGKKHQPSFRLIVGEKREKLNGRQLEDLGWYNPGTKKHEFNKARVEYWLSKGAQKTDTVHNLLLAATMVTGKKIAVHKQPKKAKGAEAAKPAEVKVEAPVADAVKKE